MSKTYSAGIVTAYGAAKRAGYQGTYEDFFRQQAGYAESAATVEQAKQTASQSAQTAVASAQSASQSAQSAERSAELAGQHASEAGYVIFDVNDQDGKLYVKKTDNMSAISFEVNESNGTLGVIII